jgi:hypothetical protein
MHPNAPNKPKIPENKQTGQQLKTVSPKKNSRQWPSIFSRQCFQVENKESNPPHIED